jgi:predicted MFS family arabinose efflux permease
VALIPLVPALWWVYVWAFVLEVGGLVFLPARDASVPDLVDHDDLPTANGLVLASSYATIPLGAALFGLVGLFAAGRLGIAIALGLDAATYLVSFVAIRHIRDLERPGAAAPGGPSRFLDAFRIPLVRTFGPATVVATLGLGALFSTGIVFVRRVLGASTGEFGLLIALFGVGAAIGLLLWRALPVGAVRVVRYGLLVQGLVIVGMSLAPTLALAFVAAACFGAATSATITAAMVALQELLPPSELVVGFAAFHILVRVGLSAAAIGAGVAADVLAGVHWPVVGYLPSSRVVLLGAGIVVVAGAALLAPLLRADRFALSVGVAVEDEPVEEGAGPVTGGRPVAGEALRDHRHEDGRAGLRARPPASPREDRDEQPVGDQAADRGLARDPAAGEPGEQHDGPGPRLREECPDRR